MYQLRFKSNFSKQFSKLSDKVQQDVSEVLLDLQEDPFLSDSDEMREQYAGFRRIRIGTYRLIYEVDEDEQTVWVWKVAKRTKTTYNTISE